MNNDGNLQIFSKDVDFNKLYDDFIKYYNSKHKIIEIKEILNLTEIQYRYLKNKAITEGHITLRKKSIYKKPKYYSKKNNGKFIVTRTFDDYSISITCKTEKQAQKCVQLLNECNWNKKETTRIKKELGLL